MVSYGPWQDGLIHEVLLYPVNSPNFPGSEPLPGTVAPAGLEYLQGSALPGFGFVHPGYANDGEDAVELVWNATADDNTQTLGAMSDCVRDHAYGGDAGSAWNSVSHTCRTIVPGAASFQLDGIGLAGWNYEGDAAAHSVVWGVTAGSNRLSFRLSNAQIGRGVEPAMTDWPSGVVDVEVLDYRPRTFLEAEAMPWFGVPTYKMFIKDAGDPGTAWLDTASATLGRPGTIPEAFGYTEHGAFTTALNIDALQEIADTYTVQTLSTQIANPLYPRFGLVPERPASQSHDGTASDEVSELDFAVRLVFQTAPYRFVYDRVSAPPQRVYPRDDGRLGQPSRVFPRPKSHQSSPRRTSGYL